MGNANYRRHSARKSVAAELLHAYVDSNIFFPFFKCCLFV